VAIHPLSEVHPNAVLAEGVSVGPFTCIGPGAVIGEGTEIGPGVLITGQTVIGKQCKIFHGASIGGEPQVLGFKDVPSGVVIGDRTTIREYVTIHRSMHADVSTRVGDDCLLMAYVHIAHDCVIGNRVIIVNSTGLSGHIVVEDRAFISGMVAMHQFVRIGRHAMVGGSSGVRKDILPYSLVEGYPARLVSLNSVGLRRSDFPPSVRLAIKEAFKIIRDPGLNLKQAVRKIEQEIEMLDEIRYLIDFIGKSTRGITT